MSSIGEPLKVVRVVPVKAPSAPVVKPEAVPAGR